MNFKRFDDPAHGIKLPLTLRYHFKNDVIFSHSPRANLIKLCKLLEQHQVICRTSFLVSFMKIKYYRVKGAGSTRNAHSHNIQRTNQSNQIKVHILNHTSKFIYSYYFKAKCMSLQRLILMMSLTRQETVRHKS